MARSNDSIATLLPKVLRMPSISSAVVMERLSHGPEAELERLTDRQLFAAALDRELHAAVLVGLDAMDRTGSHDDAAVDLPENFRIEHRQQLAQWRADLHFIVGGDHAHVLILRAEEQDFIDAEHAGHVARAARDP